MGLSLLALEGLSGVGLAIVLWWCRLSGIGRIRNGAGRSVLVEKVSVPCSYMNVASSQSQYTEIKGIFPCNSVASTGKRAFGGLRKSFHSFTIRL